MRRSLFPAAILMLLAAGPAMTARAPGERLGFVPVQEFPEVERVWTDSAALEK